MNVFNITRAGTGKNQKAAAAAALALQRAQELVRSVSSLVLMRHFGLLKCMPGQDKR